MYEREEKYDPREHHRVKEGITSMDATRAQLAEAAHYDREYSRSDEPSDARIISQLAFMNEQLMITQKMFSELQNRIEPVLIPDMDDQKAEVSSPPRKLASELSNVIDDLNGQITRLQYRIETTARRVQL